MLRLPALIALAAMPLLASQSDDDFFESKIRPVLAAKCYACHSAKLKAPFGGLRLDSRAALRQGGDSGPALVEGKPDQSLLIEVISYTNRSLQMPPTGKLPDSTIDDFKQWIRLGAPDPRTDQAPSNISKSATKPLWATQPLRRRDAKSIDQLVKLSNSKPVTPRQWLRRVTYDLTGLPPTSAELNTFLASPSPQAEARVIDRLLASPQYGERWARHWLDLVRFAETNGHEYDNEKLDAWRYRDYLIRAFNQDLPYNQFIREHIAGDLLPTPRIATGGSHLESPLATSFFWFGEILNSATDSGKTRADRVDNQIDVLSKTFLGLTLSCARCHDHKFDPLPTADYYAMAGILHSTYVRESVIDSPARISEIKAARAQLSPIPSTPRSQLTLRHTDQIQADFSNPHEWTRAGQAFATTTSGSVADSRAEGSLQLVGSLTSNKFRMPKLWMHVHIAGSTPDKKILNGGDLRVTLVADDHKAAHFYAKDANNFGWQTTRMTKEIGRECYFEIVDRSRTGFLAVDRIVLSDEETPPTLTNTPQLNTLPATGVQIPESAFAMQSVDEAPHDVRLHIRGSHQNLGPVVPRGMLTAIPVASQPIKAGSGRTELAAWLTNPANTLPTRVLVNRIWQHHFGQGIVKSVDNFGKMGDAPTSHDLLDHLATYFIDHNYSIKQLQRYILLSDAYRAPSTRRLDAESIRDAMLAISGSLDKTLYGPSIIPFIGKYQDGRGKPVSGPLDGDNRRSIYIQVRRNFLTPLFLAFDYPLPLSTIGSRGSSTVPSQALLLLNNAFVLEQASRWAKSAEMQQPDPTRRIQLLFEQAFGRPPEDWELKDSLLFTKDHDWADLCHVLFNSAEFIYVP